MARRKSHIRPRAQPGKGNAVRRGARARPPRAAEELAVVAIGASAGGLDPIGRFLGAMPTKSGLAFVVIQHLDPASRSMLSELLAKHTKMEVRPAEDGMALKPNEVYVIPPGIYLSIEAGIFHFSAALPGQGARMPIDVFLRSLALDRGNRGIGIIMSSTGTDGAQGLRALKDAGGRAHVQDPGEAQHEGMPQHAASAAHPDYVLPVLDMPRVLMRYLSHRYVNPAHAPAAGRERAAEPPLGAFIDLLRESTGQNFERYKTGTLRRRIERRMAAQGTESWTDYLALLRENPDEADALAKDLLINVTRFFRDPDAFASLALLLPGLLQTHTRTEPLRVWVPGCSSGEEAYSLGILILEQIAAARRRIALQVFATDIDDDALQIARAGTYPESIQTDLSPARLEQFFLRENGFFKAAKELRQSVIFSRHDVLHDPPFSRLDVVSCRNLLIYLKPDAQKRVLTTLHFSLRESGILFLGSAESVAAAADLFEPADERSRIYRRRGHARVRPNIALAESGRQLGGFSQAIRLTPPPTPSLADHVQRTMLEVYAPAAVVTNRLFAPVYYVGATDRYLQLVPGEPNQDILSMAREGLRAKLRETATRAFRGKRPASAHGVTFKREGRESTVTIEARRIAEENDDLILVSFIDELPPAAKKGRGGQGQAASSELTRLRDELKDSRRELNRTIHDLRRINEEFKSKNEEAMSLNEEFLSTNEELESSKEELQSLNEELTTVNGELRQALEIQKQASTDLSNLLNSSAVATILLDADLHIKVFNPRMRVLFSLIDGDVGRPLGDLLPKFSYPALLDDARAACSKGTSSEREIHAESGAWYARSVLPYTTESGAIEGAVVTFADVSRLKQAEVDAAAARTYAETIIDTVRQPLAVLDAALRFASANSAFRSAFKLAPGQITGKGLGELAKPLLSAPELDTALKRVSENEQGAERIEVEIDHPNGGLRVWRASAQRFRVSAVEAPMILLALDDITDERRILRNQLQLMIDALPEAFLATDDERMIRFVSKQLESLFGYRGEELIGQPVEMLVPSDLRPEHARLHSAFVAKPMTRPMGTGLDINGVTKDGREIPLDISLSPVPTADGKLVIAVVHDLRPQRENEKRLQEAKTAADRANMAKTRFLAAASHDLRQPLQTMGLLHGVLQTSATDLKSREVLAKLDDSVADMTALLDTLLQASQIESGTVKPEITEFPVAALLARSCDDFAALATSKGLTLHCVPSSAAIRSDRRLLARMLGNLLSNAVKYTDHGKLLLGCRRSGQMLRIEVWDTGIGIPPGDIDAIFEEFYRVDRSGTGTGTGLGLGLYIVQRFASLLGHRVEIRSNPGMGTMISIIVPRVDASAAPTFLDKRPDGHSADPVILLIEDNPNQLDALRSLLEVKGYYILAARNGEDALVMLRGPSAVRPDVLVVDYNLGRGMSGTEAIEELRSLVGAAVPALIVSGGKSPGELDALEADGQPVIGKPIRAPALIAAIEALVKKAKPEWIGPAKPTRMIGLPPQDSKAGDVAIIDDEPGVRDAFRMMLEADGESVATYPSAEAFLGDPQRGRFRCLVVDLMLTGIDGITLQNRLKSENSTIPIVFVTGSSELPVAVRAMREGAADFLEKPVGAAALGESVRRAIASARQTVDQRAEAEAVTARLATLTGREREVIERVVTGEATKSIAADLGISERTAEHHRQNAMHKMGAKSLAMLVRMLAPRGSG